MLCGASLFRSEKKPSLLNCVIESFDQMTNTEVSGSPASMYPFRYIAVKINCWENTSENSLFLDFPRTINEELALLQSKFETLTSPFYVAQIVFAAVSIEWWFVNCQLKMSLKFSGVWQWRTCESSRKFFHSERSHLFQLDNTSGRLILHLAIWAPSLTIYLPFRANSGPIMARKLLLFLTC